MSRDQSAATPDVATYGGAEIVAFRKLAAGHGQVLSLRRRLVGAGRALTCYLCDAYQPVSAQVDQPVGSHEASVVAVMATLAAECALRAAETARRSPLEITDGGWVLGAWADGVLFANGETYSESKGIAPTVLDLVAEALIDRDPTARLPDLDRAVARAESHMGTMPYPVLTVPVSHRPRVLLRPAAARHRGRIASIAAAEGFATPGEVALALGEAIGIMIRNSAEPGILAALATEVSIGSARLAPLPFAVN